VPAVLRRRQEKTMSEAKTVQKRVKPVTIRCGAEGCTAKAEGAATFTGDDDVEVIAPRGWKFGARDPRATNDVVYGRCPAHAGT
jgi:hypothetical protein